MSIYASSPELITRTEDELETAFQITRLGDAKQLLGMEIHRDRQNGTITITQTNYINKILVQHGMDAANPVSTPMDPNVKLEKLPDGQSYADIKHLPIHGWWTYVRRYHHRMGSASTLEKERRDSG
jgi:hypothetical protein